jgi:CheY-like chemotaxis protein
VYGILKSHGGFIVVESEPNIGTTFMLFLPATELRPAVERLSEPPLQHGTGTILVVDDEELIVKVCARLLTRMGYAVLTATSGREALAQMAQHRGEVSLVMLDMVMPGMSGSQTYDALQDVAPGVKVLLCSGYSVEGQAQEILERGCNGFLQKPFDATTLSAKLREILQ